jgi:hypothetical protein
MHSADSATEAPRCIVCVGKHVAANPSSKHFIDIWAALEAGGLFDPFDGQIRCFNHVVASARLPGIFDLQTPW